MADASATSSAAPAANSTAPVSDASAPQDASQGASADLAQAAQAVQADPNASPAAKKQAAKMLKSLRLKVDGREVEERLPFEIPDTAEARDYMTRQLQMGKAAQKRMGEKAQLEQQISNFLSELKKNPKKVLSDPSFGVDIKRLAADVIEEEVANSAKSPDQLAREAIERELQSLKEQRKREQEEYTKKEQERLTQMEFERYDAQMTSALETSDLPKSPYIVKKMADYMMLGLQNGMDVSPSDVIPLVREEILDDIRQMAQAMPIETLEKLFGGDILQKIRKKNVAKAKQAPTVAKPQAPDVGVKPASKPKEEPKKTFKQLFGI